MTATLVFLAYIAFLFKFSDIDRCYLYFAAGVGVLVQCGHKFGIIGLIVAICIAKFLKDLFGTG